MAITKDQFKWADPSKPVLAGRFFLDGAGVTPGKVVGFVGRDHVLVQFWRVREQKVVPITRTADWLFFESFAEMKARFDPTHVAQISPPLEEETHNVARQG